jgi:hypothetical protein
MTDETTEVTSEQQNNGVNISIEQICAAIIKTLTEVEVSLEDLLTNYSDKSIAIKQDPETKAITFALADNASIKEAEQKPE